MTSNKDKKSMENGVTRGQIKIGNDSSIKQISSYLQLKIIYERVVNNCSTQKKLDNTNQYNQLKSFSLVGM